MNAEESSNDLIYAQSITRGESTEQGLKDLIATLSETFTLNRHVNVVAGNMAPMNLVQAATNAYAQLPIIRQEVREARDALIDGDRNNIRKELADIIVTVDGLRYRSEFDLTKILETMMDFEVIVRMFDKLTQILEVEVPAPEPNSEDEFLAFSVFGLEFLESCLAKLETSNLSGGDVLDLSKTVACLLYVVVSDVADEFGFNILEDQHVVYRSNMSKFDTDIEDATRGLEKFAAQGIKVRIDQTEYLGMKYYVLKSDEDQTVNGKHYPKNKFLKSINYKDAQWEGAADH